MFAATATHLLCSLLVSSTLNTKEWDDLGARSWECQHALSIWESGQYSGVCWYIIIVCTFGLQYGIYMDIMSDA